MNVGMLRKEYDLLKPYERACLLVREMWTKQRDSECDALASPHVFDALWLEAWQFIFLLVASTAVCRALQAEKAFLLLVASQEEPTPEMLQLPSIGAGWCTALARLADKTGAPLIEQSNAIIPGFVEETLVDHPIGSVDDGMQFNVLAEMWNTHCKYCNKNDAGREVQQNGK